MSCDVSIVLPCLDEAEALPFALESAFAAARRLEAEWGFQTEIVLADNGSTDGSREIAAAAGARVVPVAERGYGAALIGGFTAARGRFLVMGDADGSYDFTDAVPMVVRLAAGAELCMGSRFKGGIERGAMPWKNRWIGNPILTGILNLFFHAGVDDAHCGLRALTKAAFERLRLSGTGMEFASEMVIKAALLGIRIEQVPAKLLRDKRSRPPHLRPWRDGWRHLRYLLMLSPAALFAWPAALAALLGTALLGASMAYDVAGVPLGPDRVIGPNWTIFGAALVSLAHMSAFMALAAHLYGVSQGYRTRRFGTGRLRSLLTLETLLVAGVMKIAGGVAVLATVATAWTASSFTQLPTVVPAVLGTLLVTMGVQNVLGGFMLAVISGNTARFMDREAAGPAEAPPLAAPDRRAA